MEKVMNKNIHNISNRLYKMKITDADTVRYGDVYAKNLNQAFKIFNKRMRNLTRGDTEITCINQNK